jgi:RimJ/RimL family protein N-acetyltransferase
MEMNMRPILRGDRLYLRLVEEEDIPKRVEWINDPDIQSTLHYDYPTSFARGKKWFERIVSDTSRVDFSIIIKESDSYIGFCGLINIDRITKKAELYNVIGEKNIQGKGFGTEAEKITINYGFIEIGLNRIYGYQNVENHAALKVVTNIGWKLEGTLRQDLWAHGKLYDKNVVSILRREWEVHAAYDFG